VKSIDTNVLFYATNENCAEYVAARRLVDSALATPHQWMIADQVYFELYRLLRNPVVLEKPLSATEAADVVKWYRSTSGWLRCAWDPEMMPTVEAHWRTAEFSRKNTFDLILAASLEQNGVAVLYTRNTTDFENLRLIDVKNPIDG
jgi:predicted nucleic acid-binding protein